MLPRYYTVGVPATSRILMADTYFVLASLIGQHFFESGHPYYTGWRKPKSKLLNHVHLHMHVYPSNIHITSNVKVCYEENGYSTIVATLI